MSSWVSMLHFARLNFSRQYSRGGISCRVLSSRKKKPVVQNGGKKNPPGTTSLFFPWMNNPFGRFPKDSSLPHPGCGRFSRYVSLGTMSYLCRKFNQKPFSAKGFAKEASEKVQALTKAIDAGEVKTILALCNEGMGSLLGTTLLVMPKRGLTVKLKLVDEPIVRVAGGSILAFNTREDPRTLMKLGVDAVRMKTKVVSPPLMPYLKSMIQEGQSRGLFDARTILFRVYVHIKTKEIFYFVEENKITIGSEDVRESSHVITFQTLFRPQPQMMQGTGFYDDQGWVITDIDLMMLKSMVLKHQSK